MKKLLLFLILLLVPCMVLADNEVFKEISRIEDVGFANDIVPYKEGYLISELMKDNKNNIIEYVNKNGEVLKQYILENEEMEFLQILTNGDDIYTVSQPSQNTGNFCRVLKLNSDLEKQGELIVNDCQTLNLVPRINSYDYHPAIIKNDNVVILTRGSMRTANKSLTAYTTGNISSPEQTKDYFPEYYNYYKIYEILGEESLPVGVSITDEYITVIAYMDLVDICKDGNCGEREVVLIYDKEYNLVNSITIPSEINENNQYEVLNAKIIKGHLVVALFNFGGTTGEDSFATKLLVYDLEGNLIQTIHLVGYLSTFLEEYENGFISNALNGPEDNMGGNLLFYSMVSPIDVPTIDHGRVIVPSTGAIGETITVEVKPDKGYTLGELIVMDANGNKLPVTNNTFVMGTSKVTVSALFVPENPNTGNLYVILICLIAAISGIVLITQKKKLDFLK